MGALTISAPAWQIKSMLREEFLVPAHEAGDTERVDEIRVHLAWISERIRHGDTKIYSEVFGCWVNVTE